MKEVETAKSIDLSSIGLEYDMIPSLRRILEINASDLVDGFAEMFLESLQERNMLYSWELGYLDAALGEHFYIFQDLHPNLDPEVYCLKGLQFFLTEIMGWKDLTVGSDLLGGIFQDEKGEFWFLSPDLPVTYWGQLRPITKEEKEKLTNPDGSVKEDALWEVFPLV